MSRKAHNHPHHLERYGENCHFPLMFFSRKKIFITELLGIFLYYFSFVFEWINLVNFYITILYNIKFKYIIYIPFYIVRIERWLSLLAWLIKKLAIIPLLRYNSHTLQFTHIKYTVLWFFIYNAVQSYNPHALLPSQTVPAHLSNLSSCHTSFYTTFYLHQNPKLRCSHPALHTWAIACAVTLPRIPFPSIFYPSEPIKTFSHSAHKTRQKNGVWDTRHVCHSHFELCGYQSQLQKCLALSLANILQANNKGQFSPQCLVWETPQSGLHINCS